MRAGVTGVPEHKEVPGHGIEDGLLRNDAQAQRLRVIPSAIKVVAADSLTEMSFSCVN